MTDRPTDQLEHVARAEPPWRDPVRHLTECGRPAADLPAVLSRDQLTAKIKALGKVRAAMSTCMTCWDTSQRWGGEATFDSDPVAVVLRDLKLGGNRPDIADRLAHELRSLAALVAAHPDEYTQAVTDHATAVRLDAHRRRRRA